MSSYQRLFTDTVTVLTCVERASTTTNHLTTTTTNLGVAVTDGHGEFIAAMRSCGDAQLFSTSAAMVRPLITVFKEAAHTFPPHMLGVLVPLAHRILRSHNDCACAPTEQAVDPLNLALLG